MKTRIPFILALLLAAGTTVRAATNDVLTVAVFDFESKDEAVRDLGPKVATLVNANLSAEPQIITVERAELEKVLGEQELGLSGTVYPDTAAKVGQLTGAKVLVTGRVFKADDRPSSWPRSSAPRPAGFMAKWCQGRTVGHHG